MSKKFYKYLLGTIGKALPRSGLPLGSIGKKFRQFCAKRIVQQMGIPGNIEKGAVLHETNIIGNKTAIGINCILTEGVVLGSHVMMGPECLIYTRNHKFDKEAKKYIGYTDVRPVIIEDFVWLGARVINIAGGDYWKRLYDWSRSGCYKKRTTLQSSCWEPSKSY